MATSPKSEEMTTLLDLLVEELMDTPDAEILAEVDGAAERANGLELLKAAKSEAGRRRLATARAAMKAQETTTDSVASATTVTAAEARAFIAQASNDPRFTLAARKVGEMSDEEVIDLFVQAQSLLGRSTKKLEGPHE